MAATLMLVPVGAAQATRIAPPAFPQDSTDKPGKDEAQTPQFVINDYARAWHYVRLQPDRAWTDTMVRPCVRSGDRLTC